MDGIFETVIISFKLLFRSSEDSIIPMTEKLHGEPEKQYSQKQPLSDKRYCPKGYASGCE